MKLKYNQTLLMLPSCTYRAWFWIAGLYAFLTTFASITYAQSVELAWGPTSRYEDGSPLSTVSYRVHFGTKTKTYSFVRNAGSETKLKVNGLQYGQIYFFAVTAMDVNGVESPYSNEVSTIISIGGNPDRDTDGDSIPDDVDNCPGISNPDQEDRDGDTHGDLCDPDPDNPNLRIIRLDFDGDGFTDTGVRTESRRKQYLIMPSGLDDVISIKQGKADHFEAHGDYNGDLSTDIATVRKKGNRLIWKVRDTISGKTNTKVFGHGRDLIIAGCDFNGDLTVDQAIINRRGRFRVKLSSTNVVESRRLAVRGAISAVTCGHFDSDNKDDLVVLGGAKRTARRRRPRKLLLTVQSLSRGLLLKQKVRRTKNVVAVDINGDNTQEACIFRRGNKLTRTLSCYMQNSNDSVEIDLPAFKKITAATLQGEGGAAYDGLIMQGKDRSLKKFHLESFTTEELGVTIGRGQELMPGVNTGVTRNGAN